MSSGSQTLTIQAASTRRLLVREPGSSDTNQVTNQGHNKKTGQHWVDYIDARQYKQFCLTANHALTPDNNLRDAMDASILPRTYGKEQVNKMIKQLKQDDHNVIEEVIVAQHEDDRTIQEAVKAGLPSKEKRMMSAHDFHCMMGHLGADPDCVICKEAKGTMRYIRRTVDPHRETRVAFTFVLDMLRGQCKRPLWVQVRPCSKMCSILGI